MKMEKITTLRCKKKENKNFKKTMKTKIKHG